MITEEKMTEKWLEEGDIHWAYFLTLEEDLHRLSRFIEISEGNFSTHSIECTRLLMASCSEAEVVLKLAAGLERGKYLKDCLAPLADDANLLLGGIVLVRRSGLEIQPWKGWTSQELPPWWSAHNAVKHDRSRNYQEANLKNALYALTGLFAAVLLYLRRNRVMGIDLTQRGIDGKARLGTTPQTAASAEAPKKRAGKKPTGAKPKQAKRSG